MTFLPILMLVGILLGLIFISRFLLARMSIWAPKRTWIFAGSYIVLGSIAFISLPFIAGDKQRIMPEQEIADVQQQVDETNNYVANNEWEKIDEAYIKGKFTFYAANSNIEVKADILSSDTYIYVTWADRETNDIQATYYELPKISSGMNVTDELPPTNIVFANDVLTISEQQVELTYYTVRPMLMMVENYIEPFNYEGSLDNYYIGNRILHLNVPKHMHIMDENGWLQYLYN
ncbi:MAG: hypothetical protein ABS951_07545 [Solibacillus sp.]